MVYFEAAGHLQLDWTDDELEAEESERVSELLMKEFIRLSKLAEIRRKKELDTGV